MQYDNFIDSVAAFEKFGIETSWHTRDNKELAKARVDFLASTLKAIPPFSEQNLNITINIEQIRQIKEIASQYSVEKVILFPYPAANGNLVPKISVYGGEESKFLAALGMKPLMANDITKEIYESMAQWKDIYGIILYESEP